MSKQNIKIKLINFMISILRVLNVKNKAKVVPSGKKHKLKRSY